MKKIRSLFFISLFSFNLSAQEELKYCGADELRISTLKNNQTIANAVIKKDQELEVFTKKFVSNFYSKNVQTVTYIIPVVFHVIHNWGVENITDGQILDGLDILNKTFRKQLADTGSIVAAFKPLHADCEIEFRLAQLDPNGNCTSGINRIASTLTSIGDHSVKSIIQWPPNKYLNIYIVSNAAGLAGHCVWPADADSIPAWDGIVIGSNYVGSSGTSTYQRSVALAHECGHYLNLHHIWGGNNVPNFYYYPCADPAKDCNVDDLVADTPPTIGWQSCNLTGASCGNSVDNVQNTMDYSYCNRMFTYGQKARMQACLNAPVAGRNNLWQNANLIATGVLNSVGSLCKADFTSNLRVICQNSGTPIIFSNTSYNGTFTDISWTFPGGMPLTSTSANPSINYNTSGTYEVTLKVKNGTDSVEVTKTNYISVLPVTTTAFPFTEGFESTGSLNGVDWFSTNFDTLNEWKLTNNAAYSGLKSVMLNNYDSPYGTKDELFSKLFNLTGASGLSVSFKYAYAKKDSASNDRLQLYMTSNCNNNWLQRINLTGTALETAPLQSVPFIPGAVNEWKNVSATIPGAWLTSNFRFKFVFTSSGGNNVYIDDINLDVSTGINELDELEAGFKLFPNPAIENIKLEFKLEETKKLSISIINLLGQTLYNSGIANYSGGEHAINLSLKDIAPGMYFIKVAYGNTDFKKLFVKSKQ